MTKDKIICMNKEECMTFKNTGVMCMISVSDANREEGFRYIDLGNYFIDVNENKCLITTKKNAIQYGNQITVPIYIQAKGQ